MATEKRWGWGAERKKERKKGKRIYCIKSMCVPNLAGDKYLVARREACGVTSRYVVPLGKFSEWELLTIR